MRKNMRKYCFYKNVDNEQIQTILLIFYQNVALSETIKIWSMN